MYGAAITVDFFAHYAGSAVNYGSANWHGLMVGLWLAQHRDYEGLNRPYPYLVCHLSSEKLYWSCE